MDVVKSHDTGRPEDRLKIFKKLMYQVKKYKSVDPHLQAIAILNLCAEIELKDFSATKEQMLETVKLFGEYTPMDPETEMSIALKLCNKLCIKVTDEFFAATMERAKQLKLKVQTTREVKEPEINLSDEDDVPLATPAKFSSHTSVLIEDKDGLRNHLPVSDRIATLVDERTLVREWGGDAQQNAGVAAEVVFAYAKKDVKDLAPVKIQQYLLKSISHRIKVLSEMKLPASVKRGEARAGLEKSTKPHATESAEKPSVVDEPKYHSSGAPMPPPPPSGLGEDHPYHGKVVNSHEVQLDQPRVPHPIQHEHAMQCLAVVNEIERLSVSKTDQLHSNITDKLTQWLCPPGFSWNLTFDTPEKRKQAVDLAKSATEILNMRVRREAQARDMAQQKLDTSAKGMFPMFKYDIEREYQLLIKFRRSLFCIELGDRVSAEMDRIKRLKQASMNSGIGEAERLLFDKLLKARLNAVVEAAASAASPKKRKQQRTLCSYCHKRHPGGAAKCRKKKADSAANKQKPSATPSSTRNSDSGTPNNAADTTLQPPTKKRKVTIKRPDSKEGEK